MLVSTEKITKGEKGERNIRTRGCLDFRNYTTPRAWLSVSPTLTRRWGVPGGGGEQVSPSHLLNPSRASFTWALTLTSDEKREQSSRILILETRTLVLGDSNRPGRKLVKWLVSMRFKFQV